jgi:DtxR family transcriptional regulator, Mn-dependent transcriptional regulator
VGATDQELPVTDGFHPPVEEYLETIHSLTEEGTPVIQARIAERLRRSAPSVSEMLDRLAADGYVERSGRTIALTDQGRTLADSVIRKHRLAERLLVDVIGLPWHKAHLEAGRWEHVISDEVEARLVELLGHPTTCPHGNPIPGAPGIDEAPPSQLSLSEVEPGELVRLERITEEVELDMASLEYLDEHGLIPGRAARVRGRAPDGTITLEVDGSTVALAPAISQQVFVAAV